jgi:parallel beta-helix repeat protein
LIQNNSNGILLLSSQNVIISGNDILNNTRKALSLEDSKNNSILRNVVHGNTEQGIYLINNAEDNEISANSFKYNSGGHYFWDAIGKGNSWYVGIFGNVWGDYHDRYPSATNDLFIWDTPYVINNNPLQVDNYPLVSQESIQAPISIDGDAEMDAFSEKTGLGTPSNPYVIRDMRIGAGGSPTCISLRNINRSLELVNITTTGARFMVGAGVFVENCTNMNITNCLSTINKYGFLIRNSPGLIAVRNQGTKNANHGIQVEDCQDILIYNSSCEYNGLSGVYVKNSEFINISECSLTGNNDSGADTFNGRNLTIRRNTISNNVANGIKFVSAMNSSAASNEITDNDNGIMISLSTTLAIHNNTFINCSIRFDDDIIFYSGHNITSSNTINGKALIYVDSQNNINPGIFPGAGGVIVVNCTNSSLSGMNVAHAALGLQVYGSSNITITNSSFTHCSGSGIYSTYSTNITVKDSIFSNNKNSLDFNEETSYSRIKNNTFQTSEYGIYLRNTMFTTIQDNTLFGCGLWVEGSDDRNYFSHTVDSSNHVNNKIMYFYTNQTNLNPSNFTNAGQIILINCSGSTIQDCDVSNASVGIVLYLGSNNSFNRIRASDNTVAGFFAQSSSYNRIDSCIFNGNGNFGMGFSPRGWGMGFFWNAQWNKVTNSTISDNDLEGIIISTASNNAIDKNIITSNKNGITIIYDSSGTNLTRNYIKQNREVGILIDSGNYNIATRNHISENSGGGIRIGAAASNTRIFCNVIANNLVYEAYAPNANTLWEFEDKGNFWGDYTMRYPSATVVGLFWSTPYEINGTTGVYDGHPMVLGGDPDRDTLLNEDEILIFNTNPSLADSDMDSMPDNWELLHGLNPRFSSDAYYDNDNDGLLNWNEYDWRTDPNEPDTDKDGFSDGVEVDFKSDPLNPSDTPVTRWVLIPGIIGCTILIVILGVKFYIQNKRKKQTSIQATTNQENEKDLLITARSESDNFQQRLSEKQAMLSRILAPKTHSELALDAADNASFEKGIKAKKAGASKDDNVNIERKIDAKTEGEVQVQIKEESCIVCGNLLRATNYVCPECKTKYCIRCAITLSERKETCWVCKKPLKFD